METIILLNHYGPARANTPYRLLESGYDYVRLLVGGKPLFVPNFMVDDGSYAARKEKALLRAIYEDTDYNYGDDE